MASATLLPEVISSLILRNTVSKSRSAHCSTRALKASASWMPLLRRVLNCRVKMARSRVLTRRSSRRWSHRLESLFLVPFFFFLASTIPLRPLPVVVSARYS